MSEPRPKVSLGRGFSLPKKLWQKILVFTTCLVLLSAALGATFLAAIWAKPARLDIATTDSPAKIWLFVGLDDRSALPPGPNYYGRSDSEGARADVMLLVRETPQHLQVVSVPRGLTFITGQSMTRLGNTWAGSPDNTLSLFCSELDVPITHVVTINMRGLVALIDNVGGIDVTLPQGLRDSRAHLELSAGNHHVDGVTALALVRSRQGEVFADGAWKPDPEGAAGRQRRAGEVFHATAAAVKKANPIALVQAAWNVPDSVSISKNTGLADALGLVGKEVSVTNLPAFKGHSTDLFTPNDETSATLKQLGMTGCRS